MHLYKLRAQDMQPPEVPHALDANPINPQWHLMELYRRPDVVRQALHLRINPRSMRMRSCVLDENDVSAYGQGGNQEVWRSRTDVGAQAALCCIIL